MPRKIIGNTTDKLFSTFGEMLEQIKKDNETIKGIVQQLLILDASRVEHQSATDKSLCEVRNIVMGNGKVGLKTDVQLMKYQMNRVYAVGGVITTAIILDIAARILVR